MRRFSIAVAALLLAACAPSGRDAGRQTYVLRGATMGTYFSVKIVAGELTEERVEALQAVIEQQLEDVDSKMSTYREDSEISRLNRHLETTPFRVSASTFEVLSEAIEIGKLTGGAYDITVGPLVNAWGFGPEPGVPELGVEQIAKLREGIGFAKLELDPAARTVLKRRADLYCDLSSIAKGYAVDRVVEALMAEGLADVWVEIGGEVRAAGRNAEGKTWRLGIERPRLEPGVLQRIVPLDGAAVATSGDYRNYRERDGVRFSHIIDPRSGWPIDHRLASVSVVHTSCMLADAWATALMVLGPDEGWELAKRERLAVLLLVREGESFSERTTPAFETLDRSG